VEKKGVFVVVERVDNCRNMEWEYMRKGSSWREGMVLVVL
jgi:hypothetical protein